LRETRAFIVCQILSIDTLFGYDNIKYNKKGNIYHIGIYFYSTLILIIAGTTRNMGIEIKDQ